MSINYIWKDTKRFLGLPLTFTKYSLSEDRFFEKKGFLNTKQEEAMLYRIKDISISQNLWQKICGVGTITLTTADSGSPIIVIKNVKNHEEVKEQIHENIEKQKKEKDVKIGEYYDNCAR